MNDTTTPRDTGAPKCECGHFVGSHGSKGCTIELGDSGSGSVADAVFCRCTRTPATPRDTTEAEALAVTYTGSPNNDLTWQIWMERKR